MKFMHNTARLPTLGAQPAETTSVTLSTISADTKLQTCVVSHAIIEDLEYNNRLELPPLFVLSRIPVSNEDSPNANDVDSWSYLIEGGVQLEENLE